MVQYGGDLGILILTMKQARRRLCSMPSPSTRTGSCATILSATLALSRESPCLPDFGRIGAA